LAFQLHQRRQFVPEVLIDITRLVHRFTNKRLPTGVDRVSLAYIRHYGHRARAVLRYNAGKFVFREAESTKLFDWALALGKTGSPLPIIYRGLVTGCLSQRVAGHVLFNTGHSGLETDAYVLMLQQQRVKPVFVIHDLIPITHPEYCRAGEHTRHLARLRNAVRVASGIVCNSQDTLKGLQSLCESQRWPMPPAVVALLAPGTVGAILPADPQQLPYFVFVSTIEPRKNHQMLLEVWLKLAMQLGNAAPRLIIIGQKGWGYQEVTDLLAKSADLQRLVTHVHDCTDAELTNYLHHAQALLFPSFTEGFGMPVVEALAHGLPVIASNLPVFREFAGDIPDYIDVNDDVQWARTIASYASPESAARKAQLARMASFVVPTWGTHFATVDSLLADLTMDPS
jgi:glycosyltransferase involved in cell wall biosynthesis